MTIQKYPYGFAEYLRGNIAFDTNIKVVSVESGFAFNAADQNLDDITSTLIDLHAGVAVASPTFTDGQLTVDSPIAIPGATAGTDVIGFLFYYDSGDPATSPLLCFLSGAQYEYTTNGVAQSLVLNGVLLDFSPSSSEMYDDGVNDIFDSTIDLLTDQIDVHLLTSGYTFNAGHTDTSDLSGFQVGSPVALSSKTISDTAVFDSGPITIPSLSGSAVAAVALVHNSSGRLIDFHDEGTLAFTPNGNNVNISVDNGWFSFA